MVILVTEDGLESEISEACQILIYFPKRCSSIKIDSDIIQTLTIVSTGLTIIEQLNAPNLTSLDLRNNSLNKFDRYPLYLLIRVDLSQNELSSVNLKYPKLMDVNLSINKIKSMKDIQIPEISNLYLDQNHLQRFCNISQPQLECLSISYNGLISFQKNKLPRLTTLFLCDNRLINPSFQGCKALKILSLAGNQIDKFEKRSLPFLQKLNISRNRLQIFRDNKFPKLIALNLKKNQLAIFENNDLGSLEKLNLSKNKLSSFEMVGPNIKRLILDHNPLVEVKLNHPLLEILEIREGWIRNFRDHHLPNLNAFYLSSLSLRRMENNTFPNLRTFQIRSAKKCSVSGNDLGKLRLLDLCGKIVSFDGNRITEAELEEITFEPTLKSFCNNSILGKINQLRCWGSDLREFRDNHLPLLEEINIGGTPLDYLDQDLPAIRKIDLRDSPIHFIDPAFFSPGIKLIGDVKPRMHNRMTKSFVELLPFPIAEVVLPEIMSD